ncbi:glycosyl transferase family 39, partial [Spirillospora sp. NPDC049652]
SAPVNGTNPLAGPDSGRGFGPGGRMGGRGGAGMRGFEGMPPGGGGLPGGPGQGGFPELGQPPGGSASGGPSSGEPSSGGRPTGSGRRGFGGPGGEVSEQMVSYLEKHQEGAQWLVAVANAQAASSIILKTGRPVIAMGGFIGTDNAMTVAKLQSHVREGKLHYIVTSEYGGRGPGGSGTSEAVTAWVKQHGTLVQPSEYGGSGSSEAASGGFGPMGSGTTQLYRLG